jgi:hypothetical protein
MDEEFLVVVRGIPVTSSDNRHSGLRKPSADEGNGYTCSTIYEI